MDTGEWRRAPDHDVAESGRPHHLMVDLQRTPVGVDRGSARFGWRLPAAVAEQRAYRIQIGAGPDAGAHGEIVWDSGHCVSAASVAVVHDGLGLDGSCAYWWRVRAWSAGEVPTAWSEPARLITATTWPWPVEAIWAGRADTDGDDLPAWALLRHEFDLPDGRVRAAFVEAVGDSPQGARQYVFKLWCNGDVVGRGSVRPVAGEVRDHTVDVTDVLRAGQRNALAALCWAERGQRFAARLVVTYADGRRVEVPTSRQWRTLDGTGVLPGSATLEGGWYRAPQENWTMTALAPGWTSTGYDDSDWSAPALRPAVTQPVPAVVNIEQTTISPASVARIGPRRWLVDLGRVIVGGLRLSVDGGDGDRLRVILAEELTGNRVRSPLRGGNVYDETWTLRSGTQHIEHWGYRGFRYADLTTSSDLDLHDAVVGVQLRSSDLNTEARFDCSNAELVRVWNLCRTTIETTALDLYQDTPTRERGPYEGDQYVNQLGQYAVGGGYALARYSQRYLTHNPTWPTEYRLMACLCAWVDYLVTADAHDLAADYDIWLTRNLDGHLNELGLVDKEPGDTDAAVRDIVDWPPSNRDGYEFTRVNTMVNAIQCAAYGVLGRIAGVIGRPDDTARFARRAAELRERLNGHLFDPERAAYRDGLTSDHSAQHATALPTAFGLAPTAHRHAVGAALTRGGVRTSIYAVQFLLDALYETGHDRAALAIMTSRSMPGWIDAMDRLGATLTPEAWDPSVKPNMSFCHAWGTAPINVVNRHLLGLRVLTPGASRVLIRPQPGDLDWFRTVVPTIRGPVGIDWDRRASARRCVLDVPGNMSVALDLPASPGSRPAVVESPAPVPAPVEHDGRIRWEPIGSGTTVVSLR